MKTEITEIKLDAQGFLTQGENLLKTVSILVIREEKDVEFATGILKNCQTTEKNLEAKRIEITKPLNDFLKEVNQLFKDTGIPLSKAKAMLKEKMVAFHAEVERKRIEEQKKRDEEERLRLKKIEDERIAREHEEIKKREEEEKALKEKKLTPEQQKIEEEKIKAEQQKRLEEEEKKRIAEEERVAEEKRKAEEEAERLKNLNVKGITKRIVYEIVDADSVPREFCSPDSKKINEAIKKGIRTIQGLNIHEETSIK
jgi:hypothetical protein